MRRNLALGVGLLVASALSATSAHASLLSIGLQEAGYNGGAIKTVATDGGSGSVNYNGAFGSFTLNNINAVGSPVLQAPNLDSNAINVSDTVGGTLTIYVTEAGLTSPHGVNLFLSAFTSNIFNGAVKSVGESTYVSTSNALYGGTLLASRLFTGLATQSIVNATPSLGALYSETEEFVITTTGAGDVNDTIDITNVPEPASFAVLGAGLIALGVTLRRRRSATDV